MTIEQGLLTALTALIAALVWLVKAMISRSDRLIEQRDLQLGRCLDTLETAVDTFKTFEEESGSAFSKLVDRLDGSEQIQEGILTELRTMNDRLPHV